MRMFSGRGYVDAAHLMSTALYCRFYVSYHASDVVFVKLVLSNEDIQLVQSWFFSQLDQRCEVDVAINKILHARLRLAYIVNASSDNERLLDTVCSFNSD